MVSTTYRLSLVCNRNAELVFLGELPESLISTMLPGTSALAAAYGDTHPKRRAQFEKQRHVLLEDYKGVEKVIVLSCTSATRIRAEKRLPEN